MKISGKNAVVGLVLGAFVLASAMTPLAVLAAERGDCVNAGYAMQRPHFDPAKISQKLAETFGINQDDVVNYQQQGVSYRDLARASFMAKASGQPLKAVMAAKTYDNTWQDVAQTLGVTAERMQATRHDIAATKLEKNLGLAKQTSLDLMQQGYRSRDIAVANELAKNTSKPIGDILAMRKINNTWSDVAQTLGVNETTLKQDLAKIHGDKPDAGRHGHHPLPSPEGPNW
ncbi:MAG TPA: hypothetical protein VN631_15995 [Negativicutes bacterium]|nr:hypothetical protein [Negativicutes bacterium]